MTALVHVTQEGVSCAAVLGEFAAAWLYLYLMGQRR